MTYRRILSVEDIRKLLRNMGCEWLNWSRMALNGDEGWGVGEMKNPPKRRIK
ncbi:hypothetical protein [Alicyclobacillus suci]|uniref:hypothetical protein n=1 Tax=Alicyclobacillus suci TaxID=2816080 RepID=UPI001A8F1010|nr:hypothetical protein [Alicyclobacillus suci]